MYASEVQNICSNRICQPGRNQFSPFLVTMAMLPSWWILCPSMLIQIIIKPLEHIFQNAKNILMFLQFYLITYQFTVLYSYHLLFIKILESSVKKLLNDFFRLIFSTFSKAYFTTNPKQMLFQPSFQV